MRNKKFYFIATITMMALVSGCGTKGNVQPKNSVPDTIAEESQTESKEPEYSDFSSIEGDWYFDGDISAAHMNITGSGRFTAYYADGNVENTGYVKYEKEEIDGSLCNCFVLYTDGNDRYMDFIDDGSERKLEFYGANNSSVHYVWVDGRGGFADDGRGTDEIYVSENFIGTWGCGRATLSISENDDGTYLGKITWADSAYAYVEWVYVLKYDEESDSMICDGNATKTYYQYEDENTEPTVTVLYTNGSGSFCIRDNAVIWNDMEEDRGDDMEFVRSDIKE